LEGDSTMMSDFPFRLDGRGRLDFFTVTE
jgi:hypothetical protein